MPLPLSNRMLWALEPVPWRGLKIMSIGIGFFLLVIAIAFIEGFPKLGMVVIYPLALLGWFIGALGLVGHFRWFFSNRPQGKE